MLSSSWIKVHFLILMTLAMGLWRLSVLGSALCSCYSFDGDIPRAWTRAQKLCKDNNGELVSMETIEEWEFIKTQIQNRTTANITFSEWWIGLEKRDGRWEWLSNQTLTYNKWQYQKPDPNPKCIHVIIAKSYPPGTYGLFRNKLKYLTRGTICEYEGQVNCNIPNRVSWCDPTTVAPTTSTTSMTTSKMTMVKTTTNTSYATKPTQHASIPYQSDSVTSDHHKLAKAVASKDCLPYPLLVTAIFVSVLGGLTVLATVAFFLVPFLLNKRRSSIV